MLPLSLVLAHLVLTLRITLGLFLVHVRLNVLSLLQCLMNGREFVSGHPPDNIHSQTPAESSCHAEFILVDIWRIMRQFYKPPA